MMFVDSAVPNATRISLFAAKPSRRHSPSREFYRSFGGRKAETRRGDRFSRTTRMQVRFFRIRCRGRPWKGYSG
jgi:hypothetical protein